MSFLKILLKYKNKSLFKSKSAQALCPVERELKLTRNSNSKSHGFTSNDKTGKEPVISIPVKQTFHFLHPSVPWSQPSFCLLLLSFKWLITYVSRTLIINIFEISYSIILKTTTCFAYNNSLFFYFKKILFIIIIFIFNVLG